MTWLQAAWRELYGLFVDDGHFALAILGWLVAAWLVLPRLLSAGWDAVALAVGLALILLGNTGMRLRR